MEIQGCSPDQCVNFTSCTNAHPSDYPPCAKNAMESGNNSLQQLKAEIAALATELTCIEVVEGDVANCEDIIKRMRQLSAV